MSEPANAEFEDQGEPSEPLVLKAQEPEKQDTLVAAIDEMLLETPNAAADANATSSSADDLTDLEQVSPNAYSNYLVDGVLTNAFAIGEIGAGDRFYLIGSPPQIGAPQQAILSGVLCDASGKMLCRLEHNALTANPGACQIIHSNQPGFNVRDTAGQVLLHVQTRRRSVPGVGDCFVSTIGGPCVAMIDREYAAFGFNDAGLTRHLGLDELQQVLAAATMAAHGELYEALHGRISNQTIHLDGKLIADGTEITQCRLVIETGDFIVMPGARFTISSNELDLRGKARNVGILVAGVSH